MSKPFEYLKAIVLDWAGTTVDYGSRAPALVFQEIFRRKGIAISLKQARGPMGLAKREHIATLFQIPEVRELWCEKYGSEPGESDIDELYDDFLPLQKETLAAQCRVIPGIPEMISECRQRGLKIGSSTGYTRELVDVFASDVAQDGYAPDCIVCSEEVSQGRPAPWMLFHAAEQMNAYPMWQVVKVDDTAPGIEAGRNAGSWTVGITQTGNEVGLSPEEFESLSEGEQSSAIDAASSRLSSAGAHFLLNSAAELPELLEEIESRLARGLRP